MELFGGILSVKAVSFLLFSIMGIISLGYILGRIEIKGISLGSAGVFLVALLYGCLFYDDLSAQLFVEWKDEMGNVVNTETFVSSALKIIDNIGLILFVTAVGFIAGPNFFGNFKKNFKSYVVLAVIIILSGGLACSGCILVGRNFTDLESGEFTALLTGILSGALTSTPGFSAAKEAAKDYVDAVSVGYGIAYIFGVLGVVFFVQIIPKMLKANMAEERKLLADIDSKSDKKSVKKKLLEMDGFGIMPFGAAALIGIIVGAFKIGNFSLSTTGGCLLVALIFGHIGHIGKISIMPKDHTLKVFREFGLVMFLIGAGVSGGARFAEYFEPVYFLYGMIMTIVPMVLGFLFAKYVLKLSLLNNLGSITGGMTSTPALGTLISTAGTEDVASAYAATYPVALISVVIVSQVLILIFK